MKVTFVCPPFENIGIEYLSSVLKKHGYSTELVIDPMLFDDTLIRWPFLARSFSYRKIIIERVIKSNPDIIAFSVLSDNYGWACELSKEIKKFEDIPIVFGGIHVTSLPDRVIKEEAVDFIIIGEAEYSLLELVRRVEKGEKEPKISNVWFKKNGKIIRNPAKYEISNLDELPFPDKDLYYSKLPYLRKRSAYTIMAARGCIFNCSFCNNSFKGKIGKKAVRRRSISNVIAELKQAKKKYNMKRVIFHDETLTYDKKWLREFLGKYKKEIGLPFFCWVNPKTIDSEVAKMLGKGGCYEVEMGVQAIWEETRKKILNRHMTNKEIADAIRELKKNDILIVTDNIFGLPTQTEEELLDLARFYNENRVDLISILWLRYYPKTEIVNIAKRKRLLTKKEISDIEESKDATAFVVGGNTYDKRLNSIKKVIYLTGFLPKGIARKVIDKRLYRYIPFYSSFAVNIVVRDIICILRGKRRFGVTESFARYSYFIPRRIIGVY